MTLKDFFDLLALNPGYIIGFFLLIPLAAFIGSVIGKGEEDERIWQLYYSTLMYLSLVPGIFGMMLIVYQLFLENKSILQIDIYTQILPIISMFATIGIIKKSVNLDKIPGFGKLSGLIWMVTSVLIIMWMLEKIRIFSYMPIQYVFFILIGLIIIFRIGWSKLGKS